MKKHLLWALALGMSVQAVAQDPNAQKFAKQISPKYAKKHLSVLASDEFEGRETGKPGADKGLLHQSTVLIFRKWVLLKVPSRQNHS
jgi:hypothetical protein